jgi:hypothetical protein
MTGMRRYQGSLQPIKLLIASLIRPLHSPQLLDLIRDRGERQPPIPAS